jgi:hypothetical protein
VKTTLPRQEAPMKDKLGEFLFYAVPVAIVVLVLLLTP